MPYLKKAEITDLKLYQSHPIWMLPITNLFLLNCPHPFLFAKKRNGNLFILALSIDLSSILHYVEYTNVKQCIIQTYDFFHFFALPN